MKKHQIRWFIIAILLISGAAAINAQPVTFDLDQDNPLSRLRVKIAYYGEFLFTNPGISLGIEWDLYGNDFYTGIVAANIGGYIHPENHGALFTEIQFGQRFTTPLGFYSDIFIGAGYFHTWPDGDIYTGIDENGVPIVGTASGFPHLQLSTSITLAGWDWSKQGVPLKTALIGTMFWEYPYNNLFLTHNAMQLAVSYQPF